LHLFYWLCPKYTCKNLQDKVDNNKADCFGTRKAERLSFSCWSRLLNVVIPILLIVVNIDSVRMAIPFSWSYRFPVKFLVYRFIFRVNHPDLFTNESEKIISISSDMSIFSLSSDASSSARIYEGHMVDTLLWSIEPTFDKGYLFFKKQVPFFRASVL